MARPRVSDHERIRDAVAAAYEVARAGLCLETVREMPRLTKRHVPAFRAAVKAMHSDHSMKIERIALALNRDRATVRYHLKFGGDKSNCGDNYIATCSNVLIGDGCYPLETAQ